MNFKDRMDLDDKIASLHNKDDVISYKVESYNRIKFPRGFLRTLNTYRSFIPFINDNVLKDKIANHMMHRDTLHWLWLKTDIIADAREMLVKHQLINLGSIVEAIVNHLTPEISRKKQNVYDRADRLNEQGFIDDVICNSIKELWNNRKAIHLHLTDIEENIEYSDENYVEWHKTVSTFILQLQENVN